MFCDGCGAAVQPGQPFCSSCGKQILGSMAMMPLRRSRVRAHIHLLGIFWYAFSAFNVVGAVVLYILANTLMVPGGGAGAPPFLRPLLSVVAYLLAAKAVLGFLAGWGLLQREPWGRVLVLVLAFVSLFTNIPFGTALGVYTMWVLLPGDSEEEYDAMVTARAA